MKKLMVTYTDGKQVSYGVPDDLDLNARLGAEWLSLHDEKTGYQALIRLQNVAALSVFADDPLNGVVPAATPSAGV